jgi:hypothetical protein
LGKCWEEDRGKDRNDRDYDQKFDEGEGFSHNVLRKRLEEEKALLTRLR